MSGTFRNPQPLVFSQKHCRLKWEAYCGTTTKCIAAQIGGVSWRLPFFKSQKPARHSVTNGARTVVQIGGVLQLEGSEPIFGKGMRRSTFQWKKRVFQRKGGGNSVNEGFGKDFYRKGNSVKSFGPFTEPPDSEN